MILFIEPPAPKPNLLIETVIEQKIEIPEPPKEYTLEEKIKLNVNNCNTDTHWIRADNAECKPKWVNIPKDAEVSSEPIKNDSSAPSGWFPYGQCTEYVARHRNVGQWHNASQWLREAEADGWATGNTPQVGAIAWEYNHVSLVTAVNADGTVTVSEQNYKGFAVISTRTAPSTQFKYIY